MVLFYDSLVENGERSVFTVGSLCIPCCVRGYSVRNFVNDIKYLIINMMEASRGPGEKAWDGSRDWLWI